MRSLMTKPLLLEEALAYLEWGWSILPIHAGNEHDKNPHAPLLIRTGYARRDEEDKVRATWKPLQLQAPTVDQVTHWFQSSGAQVGVALVTGQISGRIVIDFDGEEGRAFAHELDVRPHVRTGGGYHWHLQAPPWPTRNVVGKQHPHAPDCVDVRGDGGNAVLPPTSTRKGPYLWLRDPRDPDPIEAVPEDLREALGLVRPVAPSMPTGGYTGPLPQGSKRFPAQRVLDWALGKVNAGGGGRNDVGNQLAWALYNNGYDDEEVARVGHAYVQLVGHLQVPAYTWAEFQASQRSAKAAERGEPWGQQAAPGSTGEKRAQSPAQALEGVFSTLTPEDQARGAFLLAFAWASEGRPLPDAVKYLRLIGHAGATQTARQAYEAAERGYAQTGTLEGFLAARQVRVRRGA